MIFDTTVDRAGLSTLKDALTPAILKEKSLPCFRGAEFDFPTCEAFSRGVMKAAQNGLYAFTLQDKAYNDRVIWWMKNVRASTIQPEWIVPAGGTVGALAAAMRLFLKNGKKLIHFLPGYDRHPQAARRQGFESLALSLIYEEGEYQLDLCGLEKALSSKDAGLLVLSNPQNPTGMVLGEKEILSICRLSKQYQVPVFFDEIFGEIVFNDPLPVAASIGGEDSLILSATSLGKCFSLTGVNHANMIIPNPKLRERFQKQQLADHYGSMDPLLRAGLLEAYSEEGKTYVNDLIHYVRENMILFKETMETAVPACHIPLPQGTFVVFADYSETGLSLEERTAFFHEEAYLFGDEGGDYGSTNDFVRYSLALPKDALQKSMEVVKKASQKRGWMV